MRKYIFSLLFILFLTACNTSKNINVRHIDEIDAEAHHDGFYYALPRTVLSVDAKVRKVKYIPGPYAEYANQLLGLKDVIQHKYVKYELLDIDISNYAEPDPLQFYFVDYNSRAFKDKPFSIIYNESGIIKSVNSNFDVEDNDVAFEESFIYYKKEQGRFGSNSSLNYYFENNLQRKVDTIIKMVEKDTVMVEKEVLRERWVEKPEKFKARQLADFIKKLNNQKMDFITGFNEVPYSKETIDYMYSEMNSIERKHLEYFTGKKSTSVIKYRINYVPDKSDIDKPIVISRFCPEEGVLQPSGNNDNDGVSITIQLNPENLIRQPAKFISENAEPGSRQRGFYYRIPGHAQAIVRIGEDVKAEARLLISQFGVTAFLPPYNLEVEFCPNTGFIKSAKGMNN